MNIKMSTLKARCTRNFNKAKTNQKDPAPGDIMVPLKKQKDGTLTPIYDEYGSQIRVVITHAYQNYIFGNIVNILSYVKTPKEICLNEALDHADVWEYDNAIAMRSMIEDKTPFSLALDIIKKDHDNFRRWTRHFEQTIRELPNSFNEYQDLRRAGYKVCLKKIGITVDVMWPHRVGQLAHVDPNQYERNLLMYRSNYALVNVEIQPLNTWLIHNP